MTNWSDPIYTMPVYYNRGIPYDPVRPWIDNDGKWYATLAVDGCNTTTRNCQEGGGISLYTSDNLTSNEWTELGHMFISNQTAVPNVYRHCEFVTPDYIGNLPGDPRGGSTRVLTDNAVAGFNSFFIGT